MLGRAHAGAGHVTEARKAYQEAFTIWKDADADMPLLVEARQEFAAARDVSRWRSSCGRSAVGSVVVCSAIARGGIRRRDWTEPTTSIDFRAAFPRASSSWARRTTSPAISTDERQHRVRLTQAVLHVDHEVTRRAMERW